MRKESILPWVRKNIQQLTPYSSARSEHDTGSAIFLDANENPYESGINRYPDPFQRKIKEEVSQIKGVDTHQIFLGNGSDEPIDLLMRIFCEPGKDQIITLDPTYGMYKVSAAVNDVEIIQVPLNAEFALDANTVMEASKKYPLAKILFLCSPNNPTGNLLDMQQIVHCLDHFPGIVVIDEAYIDFNDSESWISQLNNYSNLVVLQTFSKAWGMAGIRLGMCFASLEIIELLNRIKPPYNIPGPSQDIALHQLKTNRKQYERQTEEIIEQRNRVHRWLEKYPLTRKIFPSAANFLLVKIDQAEEIYHYLISEEIMVRNRTRELHCEDCLRFTIGTPQENEELFNALEKFKT